MATDLISIFIGLFFMTIGICLLIHIIFAGFEVYENFLAVLIPIIVFAVSTALAFFTGTKVEIVKQIGNAVPPNFAKAIFSQILSEITV